MYSQQPPEGGCWALFSCSWGTEGGLTGPRPGARHTLKHARTPSSGTPVPLRAYTSNRSHVAAGKSYWRLKITEIIFNLKLCLCPLKKTTAYGCYIYLVKVSLVSSSANAIALRQCMCNIYTLQSS
jgi:hypothetical protein